MNRKGSAERPQARRDNGRFASMFGRIRGSHIRVPVVGGLFDGAEIEVPPRTPAGLRLLLEGTTGSEHYCLVVVGTDLRAVPSGEPRGAQQIVLTSTSMSSRGLAV